MIPNYVLIITIQEILHWINGEQLCNLLMETLNLILLFQMDLLKGAIDV